ncbi:MAG: hypothetical protein AAF573_07690 [Bacteroidota bacterium]
MRTRLLPALVFLFSITFIFQFCSTDQASTNNEPSTSELSSSNTDSDFVKQAIAPPFQTLDVPFGQFDVDNANGQKLDLDNGTSIEIPANTFVDKNGNPVTDPVNVQYREFHNAAEILASGIPMKAFYEGEEGIMQTAGMFEINASANNEEVFIAEGKAITVNMASNVGGDNYDFWLFDREKGNWDNKGTSTPQPNLQKAEAQNALAKMEKIQAPTPPVKFDKKKPVLNFDLNLDGFPELKNMKNIFWQYTGRGENPQQAKWIFKEQWATADIKKGKRPNEYTLVLKNDKRNFSTSVCPSQSGADFNKAMTKYEAEMKTYRSNAMSIDEKKNFMDRQTDFVRSFSINKMGIYNYDLLLKNPDNFLFAADFDFGPDVPKAHNKVNVYLITNDGRSVVAFPFSDRKRFGFNPNVDNQLIAILPNNKIATFDQEDFDDQLGALEKAKGKSYTFKMNVKSEPIKNMEDLQKAVVSVGPDANGASI